MEIRLFHDQCEGYLDPVLPKSNGRIKIFVRAAGEPAAVYLEYSEALFNLTENRYERTEMLPTEAENGFCRFCAELFLSDKSLKYHFVALSKDGGEILFDIAGRSEKADKTRDFILVPDFDTPAWSKGALWYQIMPDSFYNGNVFNDKPSSGAVKENAWGNSHFCGEDYFGGDLDGIIEKLDYIQSFGVTAISLNPIWIATHQAGYGADDLTEVNPCFGGDEALIRLREETRKRGLRLCLDGVFDYMVTKSKWYNEQGIYPLPGGVKEGDPYYDMFLRDKAGNVIGSFWSHPLMDFSSDAYRDAVYRAEDSVVKTYLKPPYDIDAWRMDVGNIYEGSDPAHFGSAVDVMREMRENVKSVSEEKLLITENDLPKMRAYAVYDSKWNYELGVPLREFAAGRLSPSAFAEKTDLNTRVLPRPIANSCFNHVTTHDTERIFDTAGGRENAVVAATIFNMLFVGAPSVYFGDEYGESGHPYPVMGKAAPTSFGSMNWDPAAGNARMRNLYRALGRERAENAAFFADAGYEILSADDERDLLAFVRVGSGKTYFVVLNRSDEVKEAEFDLSAYCGKVRLVDLLSGQSAETSDGRLRVKIFPGGAVFKEGGTARYIDGCEASNVRKTDVGVYELHENGRLSFPVRRRFALEISLRSCRSLAVRAGGLEVSLAENILTADGREYRLGFQPKTLKIERSGKFYVYADGKRLAESGRFMPSELGVEISGDAEISFVVRDSGYPFAVDFADYSGDFFGNEAGKIEGGELILDGESVSAGIGCGDFTFSARCRGEGGLSVGQGGQSLYFGFEGDRLVLKLCGSVLAEAPCARAERLQLEKTGARYSAVYTEDGKRWSYLIGRVQCNFSDYKIGLRAVGRCSFSDFRIGDGTGKRSRDYKTEALSLSADGYAEGSKPIKYRAEKGEFAYVYGGIGQRAPGESKLVCEGSFKDFKAAFTIGGVEGDGFAGMAFGEDRIKISGKGIAASVGGREYRSDRGGRFPLPVMVYAAGGRLIVFADGKEIFNLPHLSDRREIFFFGRGRYALTNVSVYKDDSEWLMARGKIAAMKEGLDISSEWQEYAYTYALQPLTDFCFSANVKFNVSASAFPDGYFAVNYAVKAGAYPEREGVTIRFYKDGGRVEVNAGDRRVAERKIDNLDNESFYLVLAKIGSRLKIYVAPDEWERSCRLIFDGETGIEEGGCMIFADRNARSFLCSARLFKIGDFGAAQPEIENVRLEKSKHRYMI